MLAKTPPEPGREPAPVPKPAEPKRRTITLTNRSPIQIIEDDWPIHAQGECDRDGDRDGYPCGWTISIHVRHEKRTGGRSLVHATFKTWDLTDEENDVANQIVRVGRLLEPDGTLQGLWKDILGVGEELRERIADEKLRRNVTRVVDRLFADLPAQFNY